MFFFMRVSSASFLNVGNESCFLMLINALGLTTILSLNCGHLKGCSSFVGGGGGVEISPRSRWGTMDGSGVVIV